MSFWDNNKDKFKSAGVATIKGIGHGSKAIGKEGYRLYKNNEAKRKGRVKKENGEVSDSESLSSHDYSSPRPTSTYSIDKEELAKLQEPPKRTAAVAEVPKYRDTSEHGFLDRVRGKKSNDEYLGSTRAHLYSGERTTNQTYANQQLSPRTERNYSESQQPPSYGTSECNLIQNRPVPLLPPRQASSIDTQGVNHDTSVAPASSLSQEMQGMQSKPRNELDAPQDNPPLLFNPKVDINKFGPPPLHRDRKSSPSILKSEQSTYALGNEGEAQSEKTRTNAIPPPSPRPRLSRRSSAGVGSDRSSVSSALNQPIKPSYLAGRKISSSSSELVNGNQEELHSTSKMEQLSLADRKEQLAAESKTKKAPPKPIKKPSQLSINGGMNFDESKRAWTNASETASNTRNNEVKGVQLRGPSAQAVANELEGKLSKTQFGITSSDDDGRSWQGYTQDSSIVSNAQPIKKRPELPKSKPAVAPKPTIKPKPVVNPKPNLRSLNSSEAFRGTDIQSPTKVGTPRESISSSASPPPPPPRRNYKSTSSTLIPKKLNDGPPNYDLELKSGWFAKNSADLPKDLQGLNCTSSVQMRSQGGSTSHMRTLSLRLRDLSIIRYTFTWLNDDTSSVTAGISEFIPSPIYRNVPSSAELLEAHTKFGDYVASWCEDHLNEQVGSGECWDLAHDALLKGCGNYAFVSTYTHHGFPILRVAGSDDGVALIDGQEQLDLVRRGDILQYYRAKFKDRVTGASSSAGDPDHTSVVLENKGDTLIVIEQNVNNKRYVQKGEIKLKNLVSGTVSCYRPMPQEWAGNL